MEQKIYPVRDLELLGGQKIEKISNGVYLSVIIPAYNEEKRLPKTLTGIDKYLKQLNYDYEIIVVNDGSKDKTAEVVRDLTSQVKSLRLIDNRENNGKGYVIRQGMLEAKGEYRLFTDADNSTSINQVEKMWPEFEKGYDVVIGSRDVKGAVLAVPQPWIRKVFLGGSFKLLRKIIIGLWKIKDTQCGFKGFKAKAAKDIFSRITICRFGFDPEVLVIAKKLGYKIKEIPITWINDLESKVKFKSVIKMFFETLKIRLNLILGKYGKEKKIEAVLWGKSDLIYVLIIGEMAAWLAFSIFKNLEFDIAFSKIMIGLFGWTIHLGLFLAIFVPIAAVICLYITYLLGKRISVIFQAGKFVTVGISNTLIDWGILNLLIFLTGIPSGIFYSVFKGISFIIALINSFLWNKFWTFKEKERKKVGKEFIQFLVVSIIGFGINVGIASFLVNLVGPQSGISPKLWATVGAAIATIFLMVWNFLGYKFIVFKTKS